MPRPASRESLVDLAEEQWGLFTRRQAEATGMAWTTLARFWKGGGAVRVAHGVYRLRGSSLDDHLELRAAWLALAPDTPVWLRTVDQGVVSHRSAAMLFGLGHLSADVHEFTLPHRRQTRRVDVRLHRGHVGSAEWVDLGGLLVTRPARIAADLLADREDAESVGHVISDAIRGGLVYPDVVAPTIARYANRFGLKERDGLALLAWLLDLAGDPARGQWLDDARQSLGRDESDTELRPE